MGIVNWSIRLRCAPWWSWHIIDVLQKTETFGKVRDIEEETSEDYRKDCQERAKDKSWLRIAFQNRLKLERSGRLDPKNKVRLP